MVSIYTLTLSPSLDSATLTPQIYPEGKLRCSALCLNQAGVGSTWRAPLRISVERRRQYSRRRRYRRTSGRITGR